MAKFTRKQVIDPFETLPERLRYPRIGDWSEVTATDSDTVKTDQATQEAYPAWRSAVIEHTGCSPEEFSGWVHEVTLGQAIWQYFAQDREFDTPIGE